MFVLRPHADTTNKDPDDVIRAKEAESVTVDNVTKVMRSYMLRELCADPPYLSVVPWATANKFKSELAGGGTVNAPCQSNMDMHFGDKYVSREPVGQMHRDGLPLVAKLVFELPTQWERHCAG